MKRESWKPGNMLYPLPAVMVSCGDEKHANIITIAWAGTICTNPPMVSISIRPERYSYDIIRESKEFVINLTTKELVHACDYCGVRSGREIDKFKEMHLTKCASEKVAAPTIGESPAALECKVTEIKELGSHHMFMAEVVAVSVDPKWMDENGKYHLNDSDLIIYSHGEYFSLGEQLGTFGYSVRKKSFYK